MRLTLEVLLTCNELLYLYSCFLYTGFIKIQGEILNFGLNDLLI